MLGRRQVLAVIKNKFKWHKNVTEGKLLFVFVHAWTHLSALFLTTPTLYFWGSVSKSLAALATTTGGPLGFNGKYAFSVFNVL